MDEETREEIGRPYITVDIDIFRRMTYCFYISYETPSFFIVGQCLLQAILPKDEILKKYGVEFGLSQAVHMDNGKDFQSISLKLNLLIGVDTALSDIFEVILHFSHHKNFEDKFDYHLNIQSNLK